jgi:hypothetical protein
MASVSMYDSINPANIPESVKDYVAGYVNGKFNSWTLGDFEKYAHVLKIDVENEGIGDVLDVENGAAVPGDAPDWLTERRNDPTQVIRPGIYVNLGNWQSVVDAIASAQLEPPAYWVADPGKNPPTSCYPHQVGGADCTQWGWLGLYDVSLTSDNWPWPGSINQPNMEDIIVLNDYIGADGKRRFSGLVPVPNSESFQVIYWTETAPGSDKFDWYALYSDTVNNMPAPPPNIGG